MKTIRVIMKKNTKIVSVADGVESLDIVDLEVIAIC